MESNEILKELLLSREARSKKQIELIDKYQRSLISFTLNIPGPTKDTPIYRKIHCEGMKAILELLTNKKQRIVYKEVINKKTGSEGYISVDIDPLKLKVYTMEIEENHELGRLFDIDIIDKNNNIISRRNINIPCRKCLLCNEEALVCKRLKNHTVEELIKRIHELSHKYFSE